ncbi:hypothetical protein B0H16DRAFT_1483724 [Mycena metata]|uniref:Uncharacterized protein n=1 Tax=Mycena metata TaxID=1033252 RepID=A0AAD7GQU7_9AGAR|nr:hypothetical protein B0H16DRAFT_1483724 [Mycena metata]
MAFQFTSVPTKYVVRPLLAPPLLVMLPILLTNLTPQRFPAPRLLTNITSTRATTPSPPSPPPARATHPSPSRVYPSCTVSRTYTCASAPLQPSGSSKIPRPAGAKIQTVKDLFVARFPELDQEQRNAKYNDLRGRIDHLCGLYLRPTVALAYQAKEDADKVYDKMAAKFPWLTSYHNYWPVAVCLQGKLHNSAARAVEKSNKKAVDIIQSVAPARSGSKGPKKSVRKVTLRTPN